MTEENNQPTKFNMAVATLLRLDNLLRCSSFKCLEEDLIGWSNVLFELRRNIAPFISDTEFKDIENKFKILNSKRWIYIKEKTNCLRVLPGQISRVYNELDCISITIQRAMHKGGLLMPKSDDPRFAIEG